MGKITDALKKVTDERIARIQKKPAIQYVVKRIENTAVQEHIVSFHDPSSPVGEQFKILRTNIQTLKYAHNYKIFMLTSAINGEGKTVTATNLAIAMAHDVNNRSILLIDTDMRKGTVAKYLGLSKSPGLSEVLKGEAATDSVFLNPNIDNLTVMCSGKKPKNPSELLNSKAMEQLLASLKPRFDYIFIDATPVMPVADACILAPMADAVILVIQAGRTQRDLVKHTMSRLHQSRSNVVGYVLTSIENHLPEYLYKYMHKYDNYCTYNQYVAEKCEVV